MLPSHTCVEQLARTKEDSMHYRIFAYVSTEHHYQAQGVQAEGKTTMAYLSRGYVAGASW